jgi:hypothetical protein
MSEIGRAGQRGLVRAGQHIRHQFLGGAEPPELAEQWGPERLRVDADGDEGRVAEAEAESIEARIEAELEAAAEALEARLEGRDRRGQR